jgi:hypothetical protein
MASKLARLSEPRKAVEIDLGNSISRKSWICAFAIDSARIIFVKRCSLWRIDWPEINAEFADGGAHRGGKVKLDFARLDGGTMP